MGWGVCGAKSSERKQAKWYKHRKKGTGKMGGGGCRILCGVRGARGALEGGFSTFSVKLGKVCISSKDRTTQRQQ